MEAGLRGGNRRLSSILANGERLPRGFSRVKELATLRRVHIRYVDAAEIEKIAEGRRHGGVVAFAGERTFQALPDLLAPEPTPFLVMIDGVEDPYNFGQAIRSVYAAGATGLLLRPRNWMSAAGIVARSSAGSSELLPAALVESTTEAHEACRNPGIEVVVLEDGGGAAIFDHDLRGPLLLIVGGEQRGVTRSAKSLSLTALTIPYGREGAYSLGTAAAASIAAFEVLRQRRG